MPGRQARTRTRLRVDVFCSDREGASARERGAGVAAAEREDGGVLVSRCTPSVPALTTSLEIVAAGSLAESAVPPTTALVELLAV